MLSTLLLGLKIITSMMIAIQDIKTRLISIYLLIGLLMINFVGGIISNKLSNTIQFTGINILLITFIFGLTYIYFKLIRKIKNPLISHLGWGDILFFLSLTPLFTPIVYSYVFIIMTMISTVIGILLYKKKTDNVTIPHAGISAICFSIILILSAIYDVSLNSLIQ